MMFGGNKLTAVMFVVVLLLIAFVVGYFMYTLGQQNARLEDENDRQDSLIQELLIQNRGPRGDDGLSAYEIWLSLGNVGSEVDFIESLRGMPGANGMNGYDGEDGATGEGVRKPVCVGGDKHYWYSTSGEFLGITPAICLMP